jgi:hypothetical protein
VRYTVNDETTFKADSHATQGRAWFTRNGMTESDFTRKHHG